MSDNVQDEKIQQKPRYYPVVDVDGDEREKIREINGILSRRYKDIKHFDALQQMRFDTEARERYNSIGFEITIEWERVPSIMPEVPLFSPKITILGKLYPNETDYDKLKRDTAEGKIDGVKGYIREDGTLREDPIKKTII